MTNFTRQSSAAEFANAIKTNGFVKLRLAHGKRGSIIIPDMLFAEKGGWHFFIPSFFGPPHLAFNVPKEIGGLSRHVMRFSADVSAPNSTSGIRVMIEVGSADLLSKYPDGALLYECLIVHEAPLFQHASGRCRRIGEEFWISVFHHTTPQAAKLIRESGHFRASPWNIQGTRKLKNVCYPYFTTLAKIRSNADLERIAMSSGGSIALLGTGFPPVSVSLPVYREDTVNRTTPIKVRIPSGIVAPAHLRLFDPDVPFNPSYYEVVNPEIVRVGLRLDAVLRLKGSRAVPESADLKSFDYLVCGNANSSLGLVAPYDEEETDEVVHLERLEKIDLFEFWQQNSNSDQMSSRNPEPRVLE